MNILVFNDHKILLGSIIKLLSVEADFNIVGAVSSSIDLFDKLKSHSIDILVLDFDMANENTLDVLKSLYTNYSNVKVIATSKYQEDVLLKAIMENKLNGYILKQDLFTSLISALKALIINKVYLSSDINSQFTRSIKLD